MTLTENALLTARTRKQLTKNGFVDWEKAREFTRDVIAALSETHGVDVAVFALDEGDRLAADLGEALADPLFREAAI